MQIVRAIVTTSILAFGAGTQAHAQTYNAFKQYSIKVNPAGAWRYVADGQLLSAKVTKCNSIKKDYCWTNGAQGFPNVAAAEANKTGAPIQYADVNLPAGYLDLDPEGTPNVAFEWTASVSGIVTISGNFLGVATDEGSHKVAILHNGTALETYSITAYQQKQEFTLHVAVAAGDTIDFISYTGNGGGALSTGLQAKIVAKQ